MIGFNRHYWLITLMMVITLIIKEVDVKVTPASTTTNANNKGLQKYQTNFAKSEQRGGAEELHQIAEPRYLNLTNFNLTRFLLGVSSTPEDFGVGLLNGIFITTFRLVGYYIFGLIYTKALETAEPGTRLRMLLDVFEDYFEPGFYSLRLLEPFNLLFGLLLGRLVYCLIVFGPVRTIRGLFSTGLTELLRTQFSFILGITNIFRFIFIEGIAVTTGFVITLLVGSFFMNPDSRRRRRDARDNFDEIGNIEQHFEAKFEEILRFLEENETLR